jgi:hypothetical protein
VTNAPKYSTALDLINLRVLVLINSRPTNHTTQRHAISSSVLSRRPSWSTHLPHISVPKYPQSVLLY